MEMWYTNLDIEICCLHDNGEYGYIQISSVDDENNIVECKICGQKYKLNLVIEPIKE